MYDIFMGFENLFYFDTSSEETEEPEKGEVDETESDSHGKSLGNILHLLSGMEKYSNDCI